MFSDSWEGLSLFVLAAVTENGKQYAYGTALILTASLQPAVHCVIYTQRGQDSRMLCLNITLLGTIEGSVQAQMGCHSLLFSSFFSSLWLVSQGKWYFI